MKVLITVPRLDMPGGVANYYRTLRDYLDADKEYFEIGRVPGEAGRWQELRRLVSDYRRFHRRLADGNFDLVHLNPSLVWRSVIRDGLLLLISKLRGCRVLAFFHGWESSCETAIRRRFLWLFRLVYGQADGLVVLGEIFRKSLVEMQITAPIFRTTTVANEVATGNGKLTAGIHQSDAASASNPKPFTILFLSRLDKGKGLGEAIEAFALMRHRMANTEMVVAGVMHHEMLHLYFGITEGPTGGRRFHTPEFRAAERLFPGYKTVEEWLRDNWPLRGRPARKPRPSTGGFLSYLAMMHGGTRVGAETE